MGFSSIATIGIATAIAGVTACGPTAENNDNNIAPNLGNAPPAPAPAPAPEPPKTNQVQTLSVGETALVEESDGDTGQVSVTSIEFRDTTHESYGSFADGPLNEHFLVATIEVTSDTGGFRFNTLNWDAVVDGQQYSGAASPAFAVSNSEALGSGSVARGATVTGKVALDVDGTTGRMLYVPNSFVGDPVAEWTFGADGGSDNSVDL